VLIKNIQVAQTDQKKAGCVRASQIITSFFVPPKVALFLKGSDNGIKSS